MILYSLTKTALSTTSFILLWLLDKASPFRYNRSWSGFLQVRQSLHNEHFHLSNRKYALPTVTDYVSYDKCEYQWAVEGISNNSVFCPSQPYYVFRPSQPVRSEYWHELCPPSQKMPVMLPPFILTPFSSIRSNAERTPILNSLDISITWMPNENPQDVARSAIQECLSNGILDRGKKRIDCKEKFVASLEENLAESLCAYRNFCQTHMLKKRSVVSECDSDGDCKGCSTTGLLSQKLKCRIVATRGHSGAKCPQFHIDNVPCRWIQTMLGPGVELVNTPGAEDDSCDVIRWDAFSNSPARDDNGNKEDNDDGDIISWSVKDRNQMLVDSSRADIYQTKPGEAIIIPGSSWDEFSVSSTSDSTKPVVHKSPELRNNDQCRVLITQDVVFE
eukprot:jgi/Psemu1/282249/fgenesh1_pg.4_\